MSVFLWIKSIHVGSVGLSIAGFIARGALMLRDSPLLRARFVRVAPHVVDTVLLASAVWLAWLMHVYPFVDGWITAKVLGLLAYIALGTIALKRGRTPRVRVAAFAAALVTVAYIVWVAVTHDPRGPLALLGGA
ncbi:MAG TPA: SirB2 family protein [Burkholderiales bacterium]|nr:SirB2 family protein [Burkholderiales bacterium]